MVGKLYVVATPIGNLEDVTLRALRILAQVDAIASEDTRVTRKLLTHYRITKPLLAYYQYSGVRAAKRILDLLAQGKSIAYVTCAGTPAISDPGPRLVAEALASFGDAVSIVPIPGVSTVAALASLAAVPMDEFHFFGYPPRKKGRSGYFRDVTENRYPGIIFESSHRVRKTIAELERALGADRPIVIGRELTKKFETVLRGTVGELREQIEGEKPRGEYAILVEPPVRKSKIPAFPAGRPAGKQGF